MAKIELNINVLGEYIRLAQMGVAAVRALVAAFKDAGQPVPEDAELIRILADNSAAGVAEADALIARLSKTE